jgi:hypothetical protein
MAKEYIEKELAIKELCQVSAPTPSESYIVEKCIDKIDNMLTSDVVEVVRCKDCIYAHFVKFCSKYMCENSRSDLKYCNDFCSYGKRKID